jgi:hypothetical protein
MIDSAAKRASVLGYIIPDGTLDQGDRKTIAGFYGGILAGAIAIATGLLRVAFSASKPGIGFAGAGPEIALTGAAPGIALTYGG